MSEKDCLIPSIISQASRQYWENCLRSLNIKFLPRQCGQENLAADVHYTIHFNQTFLCTLFFPHSCGRVACQEDNTMTESEVRGVRNQTGTWGGGGGGSVEVNGVLPDQKYYFIRSAGRAVDKTTIDGHSSRAAWHTAMHGLVPPSTISSRSPWKIQETRVSTNWTNNLDSIKV